MADVGVCCDGAPKGPALGGREQNTHDFLSLHFYACMEATSEHSQSSHSHAGIEIQHQAHIGNTPARARSSYDMQKHRLQK